MHTTRFAGSPRTSGTLACGLIAVLSSILVSLYGPTPALASDIHTIDVTRQGASYRVTLEAIVNRPQEQVVSILTDYAAWPILNDSIIQTLAVPGPDAGTDTVRSVSRVCILVFCRSIRHAQTVEIIDNTTIIAMTMPQESDFIDGEIRWKVEPGGAPGSSRLRVDAHLTPAFWIPPVIGPYAVAHVLKRDAIKTLAALERYANHAAHAP